MPNTSQLIFGKSSGVGRALALCENYARLRYPLLILGPTGTGKTVLARHIHRLSGRGGAFVKASIPGIARGLVQSQLGGHVRGAFTSAHVEQKGLVEAADGGTLFLDEIDAASASTQAFLLELLDDGTIRRVGDVRPLRVDVRILAASNADLPARVARERFRADLYFRFGYGRIYLPPLSARRDEILPLVAHFLTIESGTVGRGMPPVLSPQVRRRLLEAPWPDNIRGVETLCRHLVVNHIDDRPVEVSDLPVDFEIANRAPGPQPRPAPTPPLTTMSARAAVDRAAGSVTLAAAELGVSRRHLHRILAG